MQCDGCSASRFVSAASEDQRQIVPVLLATSLPKTDELLGNRALSIDQFAVFASHGLARDDAGRLRYQKQETEGKWQRQQQQQYESEDESRFAYELMEGEWKQPGRLTADGQLPLRYP